MTQLTPDTNYNAEVHYDDGSVIKIYSPQLRYRGLSNFHGWECEAGMERIFILPDGSVYGGECENDFLGKLDDNTFELRTSPTICKKHLCIGNPDDLMTKKTAPPLDRND